MARDDLATAPAPMPPLRIEPIPPPKSPPSASGLFARALGGGALLGGVLTAAAAILIHLMPAYFWLWYGAALGLCLVGVAIVPWRSHVLRFIRAVGAAVLAAALRSRGTQAFAVEPGALQAFVASWRAGGRQAIALGGEAAAPSEVQPLGANLEKLRQALAADAAAREAEAVARQQLMDRLDEVQRSASALAGELQDARTQVNTLSAQLRRQSDDAGASALTASLWGTASVALAVIAGVVPLFKPL